MTSATQKARIRWGSDRRQRGRQRLRQDCLDQLAKLHDPKYRAAMECAIGADEVSKIVRDGEAMLNDLETRP